MNISKSVRGAVIRMMAVVAFVGQSVAQTEEPAGNNAEPVASIQTGPRSLSDYDIEGLDNRVNLKALDAWDVVQLIEFLAYRGGLKNVVIGKGVSGLTTKLKFDDVTVGDALEVVLSVNNLAYTIKGGILTIMGDAEYQAQYGASFYDQKQVRILELKYADATRVATLLAPVKGEQGTVVADEVTGTLILVDRPDRIGEMIRVAQAADIKTIDRQIPTETRQFVLQNAELADIQTAITSILTPDLGAMRTDTRTRSLIITDLPHKMEEIEKLIRMFDRRSKQVFIEAKIVQVSLEDGFEMGVNWDHVFDAVNPRMRLETAVSPFNDLNADTGGRASTRALSTGGVALKYSTIAAGGTLSAVLKALESLTETKLLSNPHVATMDGEKASIDVVTDEVYSEAKLESGSTNVVGETFQFIKVGVSLEVTPRVNDNDMISMTIRPEISSVIGQYQGAVGTEVPIVRRSVAESSVMIKNGETVIIAGMVENEKVDSQRRVPILGRIPLLGSLFREQVRSNQNRELIVFLTPRIVSGERPYLRMKDVKKSPKPLRRTGPTNVKKLKQLR